MLDSVPSILAKYGTLLHMVEWIFTVLFSIEYILRIWTTHKPFKYITSFYGIIDLVSVVPTYLSLIFVGSHYLIVIRTLRLLRVFRILKLVGFVKEAGMLIEAFKSSRYKLTIFLGAVVALNVIIGTLMYMIEGPEHGFNSIPHSIYWSIVTMTTVGYGDIAPETFFGQTLASIVMLIGYTIIAVPTGIVSVALWKDQKVEVTTRTCPDCSKEGHDRNARYCKYCGSPMEKDYFVDLNPPDPRTP
jgi:voltage-gated potassium channel